MVGHVYIVVMKKREGQGPDIYIHAVFTKYQQAMLGAQQEERTRQGRYTGTVEKHPLYDKFKQTKKEKAWEKH